MRKDSQTGMFSRVRQFLAGSMAALGAVAMVGADGPQETEVEAYLRSLDGEKEVVMTEQDTPRGLVDGENDLAVAEGVNPETGIEGYFLAYRTSSEQLRAIFTDELYIGDISENGLKDYQFVVKGDGRSTVISRNTDSYTGANEIPTALIDRLNLHSFDEYLDGEDIRQPEYGKSGISGR